MGYSDYYRGKVNTQLSLNMTINKNKKNNFFAMVMILFRDSSLEGIESNNDRC